MSQVVQCPKCQAAVTVNDGQAGTRVQCPSCLKQFIAPVVTGAAGASADDEDWLTLDETPAPSPPPSTSPASSTEDTPDPDAFDEDPFVSEDPFVDDAPFVDDNPFAALDSAADGDTLGDAEDLFAGLPPIDGTPASTDGSGSHLAAANPASRDPNEEFRLPCPVCGTVMYPKVRQTGTAIKCSDCYTEIRVPEPPAKTSKAKPKSSSEGFALSGSNEPNRPADPFIKSANELLKEAEEEPEKKEFATDTFDNPDVMGWFKAIFRVFIDPGVIIHFIGLSVLLSIPAALAFKFPIFAIGAFPLGLIGITLSVCCGFAILFGVANSHDRIEDWPTVDPTGWFEPMWLVIAATALAVGPAFVITTLFGAPPFLKIGFILFMVYTLFPIVLLSMLDSQSITMPFSSDVSKSITRCQEDWGAFYFSSGILFAGLFAYFLRGEYTATLIAIGVVLAVAATFLYFAMLGRLALAISNVVEISALEVDEKEEQED